MFRYATYNNFPAQYPHTSPWCTHARVCRHHLYLWHLCFPYLYDTHITHMYTWCTRFPMYDFIFIFSLCVRYETYFSCMCIYNKYMFFFKYDVSHVYVWEVCMVSMMHTGIRPPQMWHMYDSCRCDTCMPPSSECMIRRSVSCGHMIQRRVLFVYKVLRIFLYGTEGFILTCK